MSHFICQSNTWLKSFFIFLAAQTSTTSLKAPVSVDLIFDYTHVLMPSHTDAAGELLEAVFHSVNPVFRFSGRSTLGKGPQGSMWQHIQPHPIKNQSRFKQVICENHDTESMTWWINQIKIKCICHSLLENEKLLPFRATVSKSVMEICWFALMWCCVMMNHRCIQTKHVLWNCSQKTLYPSSIWSKISDKDPTMWFCVWITEKGVKGGMNTHFFS